MSRGQMRCFMGPFIGFGGDPLHRPFAHLLGLSSVLLLPEVDPARVTGRSDPRGYERRCADACDPHDECNVFGEPAAVAWVTLSNQTSP